MFTRQSTGLTKSRADLLYAPIGSGGGSNPSYTRIQSFGAAGAGVSSLNASWPQATVAGNFLSAIITWNSTTLTITPPASWSMIQNKTGSTGQLRHYIIRNAASQSGVTTWTISGPSAIAIVLAEYSGLLSSGTYDKAVTTIGTSTSPFTGATGTTSAQIDLCLGGLALAALTTCSSPNNAFNVIQQPSSTGIVLTMVERVVTTPGVYSCTMTAGASCNWIGCMTAFT